MMSEGNGKNLETLPDMLSFFEDLMESLPVGCASLKKEPQSDGEIYVRLFPSNPKAAVIAGRGGGNLRYEFLVGEGTTFEVFAKGRDYTDLPGVEEARAICQAVFAGKFEEDVWTVGKTVAKTIGRIDLDSKIAKVRVIHGFYPFRIKKKKHIKYASYVDPKGGCPGSPPKE